MRDGASLTRAFGREGTTGISDIVLAHHRAANIAGGAATLDVSTRMMTGEIVQANGGVYMGWVNDPLLHPDPTRGNR